MTVNFVIASLANNEFNSFDDLDDSYQVYSYSTVDDGDLSIDEVMLSAIVFAKYNVLIDYSSEMFRIATRKQRNDVLRWLLFPLKSCAYLKNLKIHRTEEGFEVEFDDVPMTKIWDIRGEMIKMLC